MEQYTVTGMSCAACSTRVEKAVSKVPGVAECSVSLLTNSMGVEGTASEAAILKAVQDAGYGASLKGAASNAAHSTSAARIPTDTAARAPAFKGMPKAPPRFHSAVSRTRPAGGLHLLMANNPVFLVTGNCE